MLQLGYRPAHFRGLLHNFVNLPKYRSGVAQLARELVSTQRVQPEQTVKAGAKPHSRKKFLDLHLKNENPGIIFGLDGLWSAVLSPVTIDR